MTSPGRLRRLTRDRPLRVLVLGQNAVGKTALIVRLITQRFIGEYAAIERKYSCKIDFDGEQANLEIMDTIPAMTDVSRLQENIRWADAFLLVYDVTDVCSLDECTRLKFLINHVRRSRRISASPFGHAHSHEPSVFLLGNKNDLEHHRVVTRQEGIARGKELNCVASYETSVRERCGELRQIFLEIYRFCKGVRTPDGPRSPEVQRRPSAKDSTPSPRPRSSAIKSAPPSEEPAVESNIVVPEVIVQQEEPAKPNHSKNSISKRIMWKMLPARWSRESDTCKSESDSS